MEKLCMKPLFTLGKTLSAIMLAGFAILPIIATADSTDQLQQQIQSLQQGGGANSANQQLQANAMQQYNAITQQGANPQTAGAVNPRMQQMQSNAMSQYNAITGQQAATAPVTNNQSATLNAMQQAQLVGPPPSAPAQGPTSPALSSLQNTIAGQVPPNQPTLQNGANPIPANTGTAAPAGTQAAPGSLPPSPFGGSTQAPTVPPPPAFVLPSRAPAIPPAPGAAAQPLAVGTAAPPPTTPTPASQTPQPTMPNVSQEDLNEAAFSTTMQNTLPMTSDQIQRLRSLYMASQFAAASNPNTPPRPTATSQFVDLAPGATPPVIRLSQGFITSLVFIDSTGAPWPIQAYDVGNPTAFNIQWDKTSNTLMIQSITMYNYGNLAVRLRGLQTPVMLTLIPGQKAVDYRVDLRVQGYGPEASQLPTSNGLPPSADPSLLGILDGVPPDGSTLLTVTGGECQAWLLGNNLYVRTRLDLLSPGWLGTMSSADGMHAYVMQPTPILLVSLNGKVVQLKIEGF